MTKPIATLFLTCALAVGCCLPALADEAVPTPGPSPESAQVDASTSTASAETEVSAAPSYYPYEIGTVPDGRQTLIVMRYRVPEGITADTLELDGLTRMGEPYTLWAVTETSEAGAIEKRMPNRPSTFRCTATSPTKPAARSKRPSNTATKTVLSAR